MKIVKQLLAIGEMKIKITLTSHRTPFKMANIKKERTVGAGEKGSLMLLMGM